MGLFRGQHPLVPARRSRQAPSAVERGLIRLVEARANGNRAPGWSSFARAGRDPQLVGLHARVFRAAGLAEDGVRELFGSYPQENASAVKIKKQQPFDGQHTGR